MAAATWASSYSFARALQPLLTRHTVLSPLDYGLRRFKSAGCLFFSTSSNKPPKFTVYAQARRVLPSKTKGDELASRKHPSNYYQILFIITFLFGKN